jgi:hypothetical protein
MRSRHGAATNDPPQMVLRLCSTAVHSVTIGGHRTSLCCGLPTKQRKDIWAAPRPAGSRSISRPSDRSTEPASGLGPFGLRSLRQERQHTLRPPPRRKQSGLEPLSRLHAALWQPHQLISGRAPMARTKILHTRGSSAPRWMGLVSRTADKANPASSVTHPSRLWPGSVGQTHSTG